MCMFMMVYGLLWVGKWSFVVWRFYLINFKSLCVLFDFSGIYWLGGVEIVVFVL